MPAPENAAPAHPVTLTPEQILDVNTRLAELRHNINNHLSLILTAAELIRRKPEISTRLADSIYNQPEKITQELRSFSGYLETILQLTP